jgi:hypothetical protein
MPLPPAFVRMKYNVPHMQLSNFANHEGFFDAVILTAPTPDRMAVRSFLCINMCFTYVLIS